MRVTVVDPLHLPSSLLTISPQHGNNLVSDDVGDTLVHNRHTLLSLATRLTPRGGDSDLDMLLLPLPTLYSHSSKAPPPQSTSDRKGPWSRRGQQHWALAALYGLGKGKTPCLFVLNPAASESSGANDTRLRPSKGTRSTGSGVALHSRPMLGVAERVFCWLWMLQTEKRRSGKHHRGGFFTPEGCGCHGSPVDRNASISKSKKVTRSYCSELTFDKLPLLNVAGVGGLRVDAGSHVLKLADIAFKFAASEKSLVSMLLTDPLSIHDMLLS